MTRELRASPQVMSGSDVVAAGSTLRLVSSPEREPRPDRRMPPALRVVSSNRLTREALADLLAQRTGFSVDASAPDYLASPDRASAGREMIVLDHATDREVVVDLVTAARQGALATEVIVMGVANREAVGELVDAGVRAFVMQGAASEELVAAIGAMTAEVPQPHPEVPATLMVPPPDEHGTPRTRAPREVQLTPREQQVIQLIVDGMCNKEIAAALGVAIHTVKSHVHSVLQKLSVGSRLALAALVRRQADLRARLTVAAPAPDSRTQGFRLAR